METKEVDVTRMLLCVVLVFGICNSFEFVRQILIFANYFDPKLNYYEYTINHLSSVFYVLNSSVNFIICFLMVKKFRMSFLRLMGQYFHSLKKSMGSSGSDSETTTAPESPIETGKSYCFKNLETTETSGLMK
jgi:hypothetical protein